MKPLIEVWLFAGLVVALLYFPLGPLSPIATVLSCLAGWTIGAATSLAIINDN